MGAHFAPAACFRPAAQDDPSQPGQPGPGSRFAAQVANQFSASKRTRSFLVDCDPEAAEFS